VRAAVFGNMPRAPIVEARAIKGSERMHPIFKKFAKETLRRFDLRVLNYRHVQALERNAKVGNVMEMLVDSRYAHRAQLGIQDGQLSKALRGSHSQLGQDILVLLELGFKTGGYFVEFGATDGVFMSNTYLLEKEFGWGGVVAEPAERWHRHLKNNRNCHIEAKCVWRDSHSVLTFNETPEGEYSTIDSYSSMDGHDRARAKGKKYSVTTISLGDLLDKYNAPRRIDYLSVDTEGSEYEILSDFDFDKYEFNVITCEHNFSPQREKIFTLLTSKGYHRQLERVSSFDDWYVKDR
jgi:FkbM family methyltransferase